MKTDDPITNLRRRARQLLEARRVLDEAETSTVNARMRVSAAERDFSEARSAALAVLGASSTDRRPTYEELAQLAAEETPR
jgi:uncharacterized membrane protein YgcG